MIRELVMLALRGAIALSILGFGAQRLMADQVQVRCAPVVVPVTDCAAAKWHYNRLPVECRAS